MSQGWCGQHYGVHQWLPFSSSNTHRWTGDTLGHVPELMIEEDDTGSLVRLEEALDGILELAGHLVHLKVEAKNVIRNRAEESVVDIGASRRQDRSSGHEATMPWMYG